MYMYKLRNKLMLRRYFINVYSRVEFILFMSGRCWFSCFFKLKVVHSISICFYKLIFNFIHYVRLVVQLMKPVRRRLGIAIRLLNALFAVLERIVLCGCVCVVVQKKRCLQL